jgi:hypothetical protein
MKKWTLALLVCVFALAQLATYAQPSWINEWSLACYPFSWETKDYSIYNNYVENTSGTSFIESISDRNSKGLAIRHNSVSGPIDTPGFDSINITVSLLPQANNERGAGVLNTILYGKQGQQGVVTGQYIVISPGRQEGTNVKVEFVNAGGDGGAEDRQLVV